MDSRTRNRLDFGLLTPELIAEGWRHNRDLVAERRGEAKQVVKISVFYTMQSVTGDWNQDMVEFSSEEHAQIWCDAMARAYGSKFIATHQSRQRV